MITAMHSHIEWSPWYSMDDAKIVSIPIEPGIYQIQTDFLIGRLRGESQIVTIGSAVPNLKTRLRNQRFGNRAKNLNRAEKWLLSYGHRLEFRYYVTKNGVEARYLEVMLLLEYEYEHWELPPGNGKLDIEIIRQQIEQKHNKKISVMIRDLLLENKSVSEISTALDVPEYIIASIIVFDGIK